MFDHLPTLIGAQLTLRPARLEDHASLAAAMSDQLIWEQHPAQDRWRPNESRTYANWLIEQGSLLALADSAMIGSSRFYEAWNAPDEIAIGYTFLIRSHWGGTTNAVMKALMLEHAFQTETRVWFHVAKANQRSAAACRKLGARVEAEMPNPGDNPIPYLCFALTQADWRDSPAAQIACAAGVDFA